MSAGTLSKIRSLRFDLGTVTLAAVNLGLLSTFVAVLASGTETRAILTASSKQVASTPLDIQVPAQTANLDVIQAQPLFHASRTFYVPPDPTAVATNVAPPDYRIVGAMSLPDKPPIAFLVHSQSGARSKAQKGDTLDGWSVDDVSSQKVVLSLDGRHAEITAAKQTGSMSSGMQVVSVAASQTEGAQQGGIRQLSGGVARNVAAAHANSLPKIDPENVGARLYRPPPTQ